MAQARHPAIQERLAQPDPMVMQVLQVQLEIQVEVRRLTGLEKRDRQVIPATREPTLQTRTRTQEF